MAHYPLLKCPNCGGKLGKIQNGKRACEYCGYEIEMDKSPGKYALDSIKLPNERRCLLLYRHNEDETLPIALPPLAVECESAHTIIDDVYSVFEDKPTVEHLLLYALDYRSVTVGDFRNDSYDCGYKTDREIKEFVLESKKVTSQKLRELLQRPEIKSYVENNERRIKSYVEYNEKKSQGCEYPLRLGGGRILLLLLGLFWFAMGIYSAVMNGSKMLASPGFVCIWMLLFALPSLFPVSRTYVQRTSVEERTQAGECVKRSRAVLNGNAESDESSSQAEKELSIKASNEVSDRETLSAGDERNGTISSVRARNAMNIGKFLEEC